MPGQVDGEAGRRAGRRVLGHAEAGREHPGLPAQPAACEAADADIVSQVGERAEVRPQRGHRRLAVERDEYVPRPVPVRFEMLPPGYQLRLSEVQGKLLFGGTLRSGQTKNLGDVKMKGADK